MKIFWVIIVVVVIIRIYLFIRKLKRVNVCKTALVGKYVFENILNDGQKEKVISFANMRLQEGAVTSRGKRRTINDIYEKVRYLYFAYAMDELGIDYRLKGSPAGIYFTYIKNPFMIETYDDNLWKIASKMLEENHGIKVSI